MGEPSRVKVTGPLVSYVGGFRQELERQGYRPGPQCDQLRLMAHVSRWLAEHGLGAGDLTPSRLEEFLVARRAAGYALWLSAKGVAPLLGHLRRLGVAPAPEPAVATTTKACASHWTPAPSSTSCARRCARSCPS